MTIECGIQVKEFTGDEAVRGVLLEDGRAFAADLVILATGVRPNSHLARRSYSRSTRVSLSMTGSSLRTDISLPPGMSPNTRDVYTVSGRQVTPRGWSLAPMPSAVHWNSPGSP